MQLKDRIYSNFKSGKLAFKSGSEILSALRLSPSMKKPLSSSLKELEKDGLIFKDRSGRYGTPEQFGVFKARVKANPQGYAFLIPENCAERENDFFVPRKSLNGAYDKDIVLAVPVKGTEDEAQVIKILERGRARVTGRFIKERDAGYVVCDDLSFASDIYIPLSLSLGAKDGDKVLAEITSYPKDKAVGGKVCEILGRDGDFLTEEEAIIKSADIRQEFPSYVTETAEKVASRKVTLGDRRDLRSLLTVTIDGDDTRDIDDAVSLQKDGENFILGVHIADVSEYVKLNGCIDKEAYARGTSVYFPDRVYPMLPQSLSNGACSLNCGEDRYAMSCFMTFGKDGRKIGYDVCESVIKSNRRLTYGQVTDVLENRASINPETDEMLFSMAELTRLLENVKNKRGQVSLDVKEPHIYVDERGEIVIPDYKRTISEKLIEQFMIAANETVASFLENKKLPCLYRVHEPPTEEKVALLYSFVKDFGIKTRGKNELPEPEDFQYILKQAEGKPYSEIVSGVMLRCMQKARYCNENLKHFGLASACYCHFTSPIRRYPDLFVHRVLKCALRGEEDKAKEVYSPLAQSAGIDCSERERQADLVERDVDDLYKLAYMQKRLGEEFDAVISGVIESGIFARLPNTVEGMIRLETLPSDRYEYFEDKFILKGKKHAFRLGDKVRVKVVACDFGTKRVQFVLV